MIIDEKGLSVNVNEVGLSATTPPAPTFTESVQSFVGSIFGMAPTAINTAITKQYETQAAQITANMTQAERDSVIRKLEVEGKIKAGADAVAQANAVLNYNIDKLHTQALTQNLIIGGSVILGGLFIWYLITKEKSKRV